MNQTNDEAGKEEVFSIEQQVNTIKAEVIDTLVLPNCEIKPDTKFDTKISCKEVWGFMFSCIGLQINRKRIFEDNLKLQNEKVIQYQSTLNYNFDAKAIRTLNQIQERAEFQTQPLFSVNQNMHFIDQMTKKECSLVTSASLPSHFNYYIQNYTSTKPLLCLDLDETLIASSYKQGGDEDFSIQISIQNTEHTFSVLKRPFLDQFLLSAAEVYELAIFTYSIKPYADQIVKIIDPHCLIKYKFYREHCVRYKIDDQHFIIIKDLTRVGVNLDKVLLIDNARKAGEWQPNNFILIKDFIGDRKDNTLQEMLEDIKAIGKCPSIYNEMERRNKKQ